jgi:hypothetical protein
MKMKIKKITFTIGTLLLLSCGDEITVEESKEDGSKNTEFIWNLSEEKKYTYSYSQTVKVENKRSQSGPVSKSFMTGNGNLYVRVRPDSLADLSLANIKMKMIMFNDDGSPRDTVTHVAPTNVVQGMKPNGNFSQANTDILFDVLLPLPSRDLKKDESDKIPLKMPFNANGSLLLVEGFNTLTFTGFKMIKGRNCAVLKGKIDISNLEIPEELKGEYKSSTIGNATYYFDLKDHCYVGADINMVMTVMMNTESDDPNDFGMYMNMKSDNVFKIRLESVE